MDAANDLLARCSSARDRTRQIAWLGDRAQSGPSGRERSGGPGVQSRRGLCRCGRHRWLDPAHPGIASPRTDQGGDANRSADLAKARMERAMNKHEQWQGQRRRGGTVRTCRGSLHLWTMDAFTRRRRSPRGRRTGVGRGVWHRGRGTHCGGACGSRRPRGRYRSQSWNDPRWLARSRRRRARRSNGLSVARSIPVSGYQFDAVLCQQGLQFFPDKVVAFREMRRVLDRGGRLALSVWNSSGLTTARSAGARSICRRERPPLFSSRQAPTGRRAAALATEAGFSDVEVRVRRIDIHLPHIDQFVVDHLGGTPVAPIIAARIAKCAGRSAPAS